MPIASAPRLSGLVAGPVGSLSEDEFWDTVDSPVSQRLLESAVECFARQGFHATTTRAIAQLSGLSPGGIYVHFASKTDVLYAIALWGHHTSLNVIEKAVVESEGEDHSTRLRNIIRALVTWHVDYQDLAKVIAYEQDALPEDYKTKLRPFRRRFFEVVEGEISDGNDLGEFDVVSPRETTRALLSLCTDIARWYRPGREPGLDALADAYCDIAIRLVRD
jgi:AcrR family transcriptional regulator